MKFLLGIKASQNISKGTITYKKNGGRWLLYAYAAIEKDNTLFKPTFKIQN
jgi:ribosomal protein L27